MHSTKVQKINTRLVYLAGKGVGDKKKKKTNWCAHIYMNKEMYQLVYQSVSGVYLSGFSGNFYFLCYTFKCCFKILTIEFKIYK